VQGEKKQTEIVQRVSKNTSSISVDETYQMQSLKGSGMPVLSYT